MWQLQVQCNARQSARPASVSEIRKGLHRHGGSIPRFRVCNKVMTHPSEASRQVQGQMRSVCRVQASRAAADNIRMAACAGNGKLTRTLPAQPGSTSHPASRSPPNAAAHLNRFCLIFCFSSASGPITLGASFTSCRPEEAEVRIQSEACCAAGRGARGHCWHCRGSHCARGTAAQTCNPQASRCTLAHTTPRAFRSVKPTPAPQPGAPNQPSTQHTALTWNRCLGSSRRGSILAGAL